MTSPTPSLTLYFLQASRSIRTAWLLEELSLAYTVRAYARENNKAPQAFRDAAQTALGKAPVLQDGQLRLTESGAIAEYLLEKYDTQGRMMPREPAQRERARMWIHAAEGTFMVHALAVTYARWFCPQEVKSSGALREMEVGLGVNVKRDLDWLEGELEESGGPWLVGKEVSAADTMVAFSVQFIFARELGVGKEDVGKWPRVRKWLEMIEKHEAYRKAVEKTGHQL